MSHTKERLEYLLIEEQKTLPEIEAVCTELGGYDGDCGDPLAVWLRRRLQPRPGACSRCGCTDLFACDPPCSWANDETTLCTACVGGTELRPAGGTTTERNPVSTPPAGPQTRVDEAVTRLREGLGELDRLDKVASAEEAAVLAYSDQRERLGDLAVDHLPALLEVYEARDSLRAEVDNALPTMFAIGASCWPGISKLLEEAGEVVQICGKLMATYGEREHWGEGDLVPRLQEELGDLAAALVFVSKHCPDLDRKAIEERHLEKLEIFERWHREQDGRAGEEPEATDVD